MQTTEDPRQLLLDARNIQHTYERFLSAIASKSGGTAQLASLKSRYRIAEKMSLRTAKDKAKYPGACRIRDVVRGMVVFDDMGSLFSGFELLISCDGKLSRCAYVFKLRGSSSLPFFFVFFYLVLLLVLFFFILRGLWSAM